MCAIRKLTKQACMGLTEIYWLQSRLLYRNATSAWPPIIELKCANGCTTDNLSLNLLFILLRSKSPRVCHRLTTTGSMFMTFCDCSLCSPHMQEFKHLWMEVCVWVSSIYDHPVICLVYSRVERGNSWYIQNSKNTVPWVNISITCFILHFTYTNPCALGVAIWGCCCSCDGRGWYTLGSEVICCAVEHIGGTVVVLELSMVDPTVVLEVSPTVHACVWK